MIPDVYDNRRDKEKSALENLFPKKEDLPDMIKLIGTFRGTPPSVAALYEARVVFDILDLMDGKTKSEIWHELSMSKFFEERSSAIGGKHADRAVEIARAGPKPEMMPISWLDRILGREK